MRFLFFAIAALAATAIPAFAATQTAVFAGGCYWCMEHDMKAIPGVISVTSGFTGGTLRNPTYADVVTETTGHYEAVRITYDDAKVTYAGILTRYWRLIDPTDARGQFCDRGPSYRAAIFVTPEQRAVAEASKEALIKSGKINGKIVTQILPLGVFYPTDREDHIDYAERNKFAYQMYRTGCGRDTRLKAIWKN
ncbi:MAG TPA: peptide-methionine (S)-S-oxide reductase MsrA [Caulobacterales bacterium]|jgi:peptide-methionine (S)-S-oxide reductase|nr:peptide-methionine (S)-S-oxide reductase MsrA [Caulobacterales bacterium]